MRPPKVTAAEIIDAGNTLLLSEKAVTGSSLRTLIGSGNTNRLMRIWEERDTGNDLKHRGTMAVVGNELRSKSTFHAMGHDRTLEAEVSSLREQLVILRNELSASTEKSVQLANQVLQTNIVVDAVTDDLNRYRVRCGELESKERQQQERIVELHARIDEQRGELNRGSQSRIALQKALDALLSTQKP